MPTIAAYAKINLGLEVLHKRPDGYHEINTIFSRVSLHDTVTVEPSTVLSVTCPQLPNLRESDNLVFKAAMALQDAYSVRAGAKITIDKHIPLGAGLGGGSSDAASALLGLRSLWNIPCSLEDLHPLARSLGADVPFFLGTDDALAGGRGDKLAPLSLSLPYYVLLVFPGVEVSTPRAYAMLGRTTASRPVTSLEDIVRSLHAEQTDYVAVPNDFESVVFAEHPTLGRIANEMKRSSCTSVFMSGSGSTIVGLYRRREDALLQAKSLSTVRSCVCSFVHHVEDEFHQ